MFPPKGSTDAHGNELQIGTNCLGSHLLYRLLEPVLVKTAASSPKGSVRVAWAASSALDVLSPKPDGVELAHDGWPKDKGVQLNYGQSKVGNLFLAREFARSTPQIGITHVSFNPGNLRTELQRHWEGLAVKLMVSKLLTSERGILSFKSMCYCTEVRLACILRLDDPKPQVTGQFSLRRR